MTFQIVAIFEAETEAMEACAHPCPGFELGSGEAPYIPRMEEVAKLFVWTQLAFFANVRILDPAIPVVVIAAVELTTRWSPSPVMSAVTLVGTGPSTGFLLLLFCQLPNPRRGFSSIFPPLYFFHHVTEVQLLHVYLRLIPKGAGIQKAVESP